MLLMCPIQRQPMLFSTCSILHLCFFSSVLKFSSFGGYFFFSILLGFVAIVNGVFSSSISSNWLLYIYRKTIDFVS